MPSNSEKVDMLLILGESHGNYEAAIRLYARRYLNRRTPRNHVFRNLEITLKEHGKVKKKRARRRSYYNGDRSCSKLLFCCLIEELLFKLLGYALCHFVAY
jgi:hypothetical protein